MSSQTKYTFHIQITVLGMAAVRCRRPCAVSPQLRYTFMTWRAHAVGSRHKHFPPTVNTSPRTDFAITVHRFPPVYLLSSCSCFAACLVTQTCSMLGEYAFRTGNQYHNHIGLSINLSTRYSWVSHILRVTLFRYTRHRIHEGLLFDFRRPPSLIICSLSRLAGTRLSSRYWSESRFCQQKRDFDQSREGNRAVRFPNRYKMASSFRLRDVLWIQAQMCSGALELLLFTLHKWSRLLFW